MQSTEQAMFLRVPASAGRLIQKTIHGERAETISIVHRQHSSSTATSSSSSSSSSLSTYELDLGGGKPRLRGELLHAPNHVDATKPTTDGAGVFTSQGVTKMLVFGDTTSIADPMPGSSLKLAPSGLTTPTRDIVTRQFKRGWRYINKFAPAEVAETERVLQDLTQLDKPAYEHVVEEIVDAEAFMHAWFHSPEGHREDALDNCTIVYENGMLTDIFAMDKGTLVRRSAPSYDSAENAAQSALAEGEEEEEVNEGGTNNSTEINMSNSSGTGSDKAASQSSKVSGRGRQKGWKKIQKVPSTLSSSLSLSALGMSRTNNEVSVEDLAAITGAFLDIDEEEMIIDEDGIVDSNVAANNNYNNFQQGGANSGIFVVEGEAIEFDDQVVDHNTAQGGGVDGGLSLTVNNDVVMEQSTLSSSSSSSLLLPSATISLSSDTSTLIIAPTVIVSPEVARIQTALQLAHATLAAEEKKQASTTIAIFKQRWMPQLLAARAEVEKLEKELEAAKALEQ